MMPATRYSNLHIRHICHNGALIYQRDMSLAEALNLSFQITSKQPDISEHLFLLNQFCMARLHVQRPGSTVNLAIEADRNI